MGEIKFFEVLLNKDKNAVERFVYYKIPIKQDAEDIIQEIFITAYKKFCSLKDTSKFKAWLLSIAKNKCNDYFRKKMDFFEIPLDDTYEHTESTDINGRFIQEIVNETLLNLSDNNKQILFMFYIHGMNQKEISSKLGIPIGTVKSRLNTARQNFKKKYPYAPNVKGENLMNNKTFPNIIPEIKITKIGKTPFSVTFEELPGWFIIPRLGEKTSWAIYDYPEKTCSEIENCEVTGNAKIHDINCVEILCKNRKLYAKLTDTHVQYIAEAYYNNKNLEFNSFLDDDWLKNWSYGENNCGREIELSFNNKNVSGIYTVSIGNTTYETIKLIDVNSEGIYTETYIGRNGRTVLWRRYNRFDWKINMYKIKWTDKLPDNERITLDDQIYVHWYDCITDNVL